MPWTNSAAVPLETFQALLPSCCEADAVPLERYSGDEQAALLAFLPSCHTVVVLAHHVRHSLEWVWFPFDASRNGVIPAADLHLAGECGILEKKLQSLGHETALLPYPGRCGVRFKCMAHRSGLGALGDSYLFLHRNWGPWVHLRVLLTDAVVSGTLPPCETVCTHCGRCAAVCPVNAVTPEGLSGETCDAAQDAEAEGLPAYTYKCERCLRACPIGDAPPPVRPERG